MKHISYDDLQDALCDMYDIERRLSGEILSLPKDNEGTETTIGDCIDHVIWFLEQLEDNQ